MGTKHRLVFLTAMLSMAANAEEVYVPEDLRDWQGWVLHNSEYRKCPIYFDSGATQRDDFICAWPGNLDLVVDRDGGRFTQQWRVHAHQQWLPLPGNAAYWPYDVTVDGRVTSVVARNGVPSLYLDPGTHQVAGRFVWDERPGVLQVPAQSGLLALTVDGRKVARPEISAEGVFLGERRSETQARDAVEVNVYRLVSDAVPTRLTTNLQVAVSGSVREVLFGPILPAGFVPLRLDGPLQAKLESDGNLRVQVRPGRWRITLAARAADVVNQITLPAPEQNLPAAEIWSYASNELLRVTAAEGLPPVDPTQVEVPNAWQELPAFRIEPGQTFAISERSRGLVDAGNELSLSRTMWLDYDGSGYTVSDNIEGLLRTGWRLDMSPPYELLSATEREHNLLITNGPQEGQTGVELRHSDVLLAAIGRNHTRAAMPVTGWNERFAYVDTRLNLPPGHKLFAAPGADNAPGSWVRQWQLLDFFLVLIITIAAWRLLGRFAGIIALLALTLSFHEANAPQWLWLNLLIAIALLRVTPEGRLQRAVRGYQVVSAVLLVLALVPFVASQLRIGIYPQLEPQYSGPQDVLSSFEVAEAPVPHELHEPGSSKTGGREPRHGARGCCGRRAPLKTHLRALCAQRHRASRTGYSVVAMEHLSPELGRAHRR